MDVTALTRSIDRCLYLGQKKNLIFFWWVLFVHNCTTLQETALSQTHATEGPSMSIGSMPSSGSDFQTIFLDLHNTKRAAHGASNLLLFAK
jgi:hypothetical protein